MEILSIVGSISSIISLLVAVFLAVKIIQIDKSISIKGESNTVAGRDVINK